MSGSTTTPTTTASPSSTQWLDEWARVGLGVIIVSAFVVSNFLAFTKVIPDGPVIDKMLGLLDSLVTMVAMFYYGSSYGSKQKSTQLAAQTAPPLGSTTVTSTPAKTTVTTDSGTSTSTAPTPPIIVNPTPTEPIAPIIINPGTVATSGTVTP